MRRSRQLHLADLVHEHRVKLEQVAVELAERGEPISELEARLIAEAGHVRLIEVENALRHEARPGLEDASAGVTRALARLRSWRKPRIGNLRHYEPKPLMVPASYLRQTGPERPPTISIVTPSYEQGRFLERTLYSVVSQKYPALEYVVQDGGSTDVTVDVLHRFEPMLTSWRSEPDRGQADAINRGFRQTSGEIMAWLNSDDLLLPGALGHVARYFDKHPQVDVVYGNRLMIDENDGQIGAWILPQHDDLAITLADYIPQETLFWRRRVWEAAGAALDTSFSYALDWDLLLRFRDVGARMVRLPRFLGAFRIHPEQKTTATDFVGFSETNRLRQRLHGREVPIEEVLRRLRPYFVRHILAHSRQRIVDRFPARRHAVQTIPLEPWLRTPALDLSPPPQRVDPQLVTPVSPVAPLAD